MSIALVTTRGFGNGTLAGTISKMVTVGYTPATVAPRTWVDRPQPTNTWVDQTLS